MRKRVTVRLEDGQLEILRMLMRALRTNEVSDAVRFCIELTGLLLNISTDYYSLRIFNILEEATRRAKKPESDDVSDENIKLS
ncbi:MAG: hypothetical protein QXQ91_04450 [Nanopusillaceae archaeon]